MPALNRIPDPEDILGCVMVEGGKILPNTYQSMPTYRVVSGDSGPPTLRDSIYKRLMTLIK